MPMNEAELREAVLEMRDALHSLTVGCGELAGAIETQTKLLVEIKEAVTAEPQGESPIWTRNSIHVPSPRRPSVLDRS
jgi:hypothetical protein